MRTTINISQDSRIFGSTYFSICYNYSFRGDLQWMGYCDYFWGTYRNGRPSFISKKFESLCWSEENPDAYFPRRRFNYATSSFGNKNNDRYLQDASYLRLKNLTFGYTIPFKSKHIQKCRVYFSGENLYYWSPLKKHCDTIDPEVATTGAYGDAMYPFSKTFSLGVDITF